MNIKLKNKITHMKHGQYMGSFLIYTFIFTFIFTLKRHKLIEYLIKSGANKDTSIQVILIRGSI